MSASSHEEIRVIALAEFARAGYAGTSIQRVAELAGQIGRASCRERVSIAV